MFDPQNPYRRDLGDNLILKSLSSRNDLDRVADFNAHIHGPGVDDMTRELVLHHPHTRAEHWLFVEDESTGAIVSALCLIPWQWRYEDVTLNAGEMGIVGTLDGYRNRGLVRRLNERFEELLADYEVSQIQGIPYFYRLLGYEYALPLLGGWHLYPHQVQPVEHDLRFRPATVDDIPALMRFYDDASGRLALSNLRDAATWDYLLRYNPQTESARDFWLVENAAGVPVGYWGIEVGGFGHGLNVDEGAHFDHPTALAVLHRLSALATERSKPYVRLGAIPGGTLQQAAIAWGAYPEESYAWQIKIPDAVRLLRKIAPVLERRIAASPLAGLTQTLLLNLYRHAVALRFEAGKLVTVEDAGFCLDQGASLPPNLLPQLVFGWRSRAELDVVYPDARIFGQDQVLIDTLFPKMDSYLFMLY